MSGPWAGQIARFDPPTAWEESTFKVVPHDGARTLVVFLTARLQGRFDYWQIGHDLPVHRLFVNNGTHSKWYQSGVPGLGDDVPSTLRTIRQWADYLGARETLFVGTSMGGYGAILFGALSGSRALGFGAETYLKLAGSRSREMMPPAEQVVYPELRTVVATATAPITAFCSESDPVDLFCLQRMDGIPNFTRRVVARATHNVSLDLRNWGLLRPVLDAFIAGEQIPPLPVDSDILQRLPQFATRLYRMHAAVAAGDPDKALSYGSVLTRQYPTSDQVHFLVGWAQFKAGDFPSALASFALS